MKGKITQEK